MGLLADHRNNSQELWTALSVYFARAPDKGEAKKRVFLIFIISVTGLLSVTEVDAQTNATAPATCESDPIYSQFDFGNITYFHHSQTLKFLGRWSLQDDGTVRQYFEQLDEEKG